MPQSGSPSDPPIRSEPETPDAVVAREPAGGSVAAFTVRPRLSAVVTTLNEEKNIRACLESLAWCDEILVVDSFSTDRTCEIARSFPNVVLHQRTYYGSASQKNWALDRVQYEWCLILDADERCTPELREEIESLLAQRPGVNAYRLRRRVHFLGKRIRFSGCRNDRVVRLVKRGGARYPDRRVHADMVTLGPAPTLEHALEHYCVQDLACYLNRMTRFGRWGAAQLWKDGARSSPVHFLGRPLWRFLRSYFLQLGFLDGWAGCLFCATQAYSTFVKWSILWQWRFEARRGSEPVLPEFDTDRTTWIPASAKGATARSLPLFTGIGGTRPAAGYAASETESSSDTGPVWRR